MNDETMAPPSPPDAWPAATPPAGPAPSFLSSYRPPAGFYDEMVLPGGEVRPHWQRFREALAALGSAEFSRRWQQVQRLVYEHGVAFSPFGDPNDQPRPWRLDPLPVLIPAPEWRDVSAGLEQRAHLFGRILRDLYGPQTLLQRGLLPPQIVFRNPAFLRPCHGQRCRTIASCTCMRPTWPAPDGRWWVLGDRSEAPSGSGFARWRTASSFRGCCPTCSASATSSAWRRTSSPSARRCAASRTNAATTRGWCC